MARSTQVADETAVVAVLFRIVEVKLLEAEPSLVETPLVEGAEPWRFV